MFFNKRNLYSFVLLIIFLTSGCGQKIKDSISPIATSIQPGEATGRIVVLPFADYTMGKRLDDSLRRQVKIHEALIYRLAQYGYYAPVEDDVMQYMVDMGIITIIQNPGLDSSTTRRTIEREMGTGWSKKMQDRIQEIMLSDELINGPTKRFKMEKLGLTPSVLKSMGRHFDADYILRGRIVEYDLRQGGQLNPIQQGILPFFFDWTSAMVFGVAKSEQYDLWQDMTIGGAMGAGLGSTAGTPFNPEHTETETSIMGANPRFAQIVTNTSTGGYADSALYNATVWGAAGAAAAYMASKGGKIPTGVVQLSLALQDARTGHVIWSNRAEKTVEPVSAWADPSERRQIDLAVEEAARVLIDDLGKSLVMIRTAANRAEEPVVAQAVMTTSGCTQPPVMRDVEPVPAAPADDHDNPENWGS